MQPTFLCLQIEFSSPSPNNDNIYKGDEVLQG